MPPPRAAASAEKLSSDGDTRDDILFPLRRIWRIASSDRSTNLFARVVPELLNQLVGVLVNQHAAFLSEHGVSADVVVNLRDNLGRAREKRGTGIGDDLTPLLTLAHAERSAGHLKVVHLDLPVSFARDGGVRVLADEVLGVGSAEHELTADDARGAVFVRRSVQPKAEHIFLD